jgi:hemolysin activation/secretion protein
VALLAAALGCKVAAADEPVPASHVTPPSLRPATEIIRTLDLPSRGPAQVPKEISELSVLAGEIDLEGGFPELAEANAKFAGSLSNRPVNVAQIYAAADALEQAYWDAGFILARVTVPPQHLVDRGPVRAIVIDGFIESIDVSALPAHARPLVNGRLESLTNRRHLRVAEIERKLLLAGSTPGLSIHSTLVRGAQSGSTRLVIDGSYARVGGSFSVDNYLSAAMGTWEYMGSLALNDLAGWGEQIYTSVATTAKSPWIPQYGVPLRWAGGGVVLPFLHGALTVNPEYTGSQSRTALPSTLPTVANVQQAVAVDNFQRLALRTNYTLVWTRLISAGISADFENIREDSTAKVAPGFDIPLNEDRYTVMRLNADWQRNFLSGWSIATKGQYSHGLQGRTPEEVAQTGISLSRMGAATDFDKLQLRLKLTVPLPKKFEIAWSVQGQDALGKPLLRAEQYSLDGVDAISGYPSGTVTVDSGYVTRSELAHAFHGEIKKIALDIKPYLYGAYGRGWLAAHTDQELAAESVGSFGVGARLEASQWISSQVEIGRRTSDTEQLPHDWRVSASVAAHF